MYKDGAYRRCDTYRGPATGQCPIHHDDSGEQLVINPEAGSAPLRIATRNLASFFKGGLRKVRIWNRALEPPDIQALFAGDEVPQDGLVADYRFDQETGDTAVHSAQSHDGVIFGAAWARQAWRWLNFADDRYGLVSPITRIIRDMSTDQPVEHAATLEDIRAEVLTPDRLNTKHISCSRNSPKPWPTARANSTWKQ